MSEFDKATRQMMIDARSESAKILLVFVDYVLGANLFEFLIQF